MAQKIKTTRMELLKLKKKKKLAQKGHKLLKEKRDALISEFFKLVDVVKEKRAVMEAELAQAFKSLIMAQALAGLTEVARAANSVHPVDNLDYSQRSIMGVKVPVIVFKLDKKPATEKGYSIIANPEEIDKAADLFESVLVNVMELAQHEATAVKLAEEIKKTKRKVNALEQVLIPRIEKDIKYIVMRLEEMERENFSRLKSIKAKMEAS